MASFYAFFVRRPLLVNLAMAFSLMAGGLSVTAMKLGTFPRIELGIVTVTTFRPGSSSEDVELSITVPLEEELLEVDGVDKLLSSSMEGLSAITVRLDPDADGAEIHMRPQSERRSDSNDILPILRERLRELSGYRSIVVQPLDDAPVLGKSVEVEVIGNDASRHDLARDLVEFLEAHPGTTEVWTSFRPGKDVVHLDIDHEALASRGLAVSDVTRAVRIAFDGAEIDELRTVEEKIEFRLQYRPRDQGKMDTLRNLVVINREGKGVPLRAVADFQVRPGEAARSTPTSTARKSRPPRSTLISSFTWKKRGFSSVTISCDCGLAASSSNSRTPSAVPASPFFSVSLVSSFCLWCSLIPSPNPS